MNELLKKIWLLEQEMEKAEQQSEYWIEEKHFDIEKSTKYEAEADMIVSLTSSQIDKSVAMTMIRSRRSDVERIFA